MKFTKFVLYHVHDNPKKGRNEPLFIAIKGTKQDCAECTNKEKPCKKQK